MRIVGGLFKGKKINFVNEKITRPLRDLVKESIFNILEHSNQIKVKIKTSVILDLYSGIGSFGIECISRGAKEVYFVENNYKVMNVLKQNIMKLNIENRTNINFEKVENFIKNNQKKFDILFLDPPFNDKLFKDNLNLIKEFKLLKKDHIIIIHRESEVSENLGAYINLLFIKKYGRSKILFGTLI